MHLNRSLLAGVLAALAASGCLGAATKPLDNDLPAIASPMDARVLPDAAAPLLDKPLSFLKSPAIATGFLGEPTLIAKSNGTLFLTFPGCPSGKQCANGPIYRSVDQGASWKLLNPLANGSLSKDSRPANGDAMISVDSNGVLYASNLGGGLPTWVSTDDGTSWTWRANAVPRGTGSDRQWSWGGPAGRFVQAWMQTNPTRAVAVATSRDQAKTFEDHFTADAPIGWLGPIAASDDGQVLFVPYTKPKPIGGQDSPQPTVTDTGAVLADPMAELKFIRSLDGGKTWTVHTTGYALTKNPAHLQWPGTLMAPAMARTGSGRLVYAWSEENMDPTTRANGAMALVKYMTSDDNGAKWTAPKLVSASRTAIMPWVIGGGGNAFAVAYYAAGDVRVLNDFEGTWDVEIVVVDDTKLLRSIVAAKVHEGGICARGGTCAGSDRSLLDFLGGALLPDGRVAITYAGSPRSMPGTRQDVSVFVVLQDAGSLLLAPAA